MSTKHPIIAVTGSSGAGTTTVKHTFEAIFHRENVNAAIVEGDSFHRYTRDEMTKLIEEAERAGLRGISHFGPEANLVEELEALFRAYGKSATGRHRSYIHDAERAARTGLPMGSFAEWEDLPVGTDCLFYEGLHGALVTDKVDVARHVDLLIGVAPTINLEWIQKLHRDTRERGYSPEAVQDTILRRMYDYVHYIVPQFSRTHINFQRVPVVDTSNPFIAREVPTLDESMVVIRFKDPRGVDFPYLLRMIHDAFMSRANSIVIPGGKLDLAMQLILTPLIWKLMERRREAI
ncbi:MAG: phosphoribulokinase [Azoarcus sp.]|uniref:Phosphoribulokinase n=1 Tax=Aromatoleum tolulyticum TaxID=34027 RepID=A0A1N6SH76_9RHOO|nr:phosphoribulokinase [Aromatoleum tolulyticum]MCK9986858.1 phosphoribulokinase [Azoarcus sp.]SIQ40352.1 phosphoribulokinase [Aromatoleum tolulyticum]